VLPEGYLPGSKLRLSVDDESPSSSAAPVPAGATGAGETAASSGAGQPSGAAGAAGGGSKVIDLSGD
jgi:hypothetical protein